MNITEVLQNDNTLVMLRSSDLKEFAALAVEDYRSKQDKTAKDSEPKKPISQSEAMKLLNRSRQTIVKWRKKGILKGFLIGGRVFFEPDELAALQRTGRQ